MTTPINDIFVSIQGEGRNVGLPSVFVRFAGCNLKCGFCDTKYALDIKKSKLLSVDMIADKINLLAGKDVFNVVITGGEPSLYINTIKDLLNKRTMYPFSVEIETNGINIGLWKLLPKKRVSITASPKLREREYIKEFVQTDWFVNFDAKLIVEDVDTIFKDIQKVSDIYSLPYNNIFLQPVDDNREIAKELVANKCYGCRLSLQVHKILGVA